MSRERSRKRSRRKIVLKAEGKQGPGIINEEGGQLGKNRKTTTLKYTVHISRSLILVIDVVT